MANLTAAPTISIMSSDANTSDQQSEAATEPEIMRPFEEHTGDVNSSSLNKTEGGGEWIGDLPPLVWSIPHYENLFVYGIGACIFFGTLGNVFSFVIMIRKRMRQQPTTPYLCSLAVVDTLILWTINQDEWFHKVIGRPVIDNVPCNFRSWFLFSIYVWNSWLLVFLTGERFIVIKFPLKTLTWGKTNRGRNILMITIPVVSFAITFFSWFMFKDGPEGCTVVKSFERFASKGFGYMFTALRTFAPCSILFTLDGLIIYELSASKKTIALDGGLDFKRKRETRNLTIIVLTVSITFLILTLPAGILVIVLYANGQGLSSIITTEKLFLIQMIMEVLNYINHSVNFLLYIVLSPRFRQEISQLLPKSRKSDSSTVSNSTLASTLTLNTISMEVCGNK